MGNTKDTMGTKDTKERETLEPLGPLQPPAPKPPQYLRPNQASHVVIGCALQVHSVVGSGALESAVCECMLHEMVAVGLHVRDQVPLPLVYKQVRLPGGYRADFIVEECLVVEIKCVKKVLPVHFSQLLTYLKQSRHKLGLLLNFNVPHMREGIRRVINGPESEL